MKYIKAKPGDLVDFIFYADTINSMIDHINELEKKVEALSKKIEEAGSSRPNLPSGYAYCDSPNEYFDVLKNHLGNKKEKFTSLGPGPIGNTNQGKVCSCGQPYFFYSRRDEYSRTDRALYGCCKCNTEVPQP